MNTDNPNVDYSGVSLNLLYENIGNQSRDTFLEQGHKKFLAARKIQAAFRGWRVRHMIAMWHCCATNIQRVWRGYLGRRQFYCYVESILQTKIEEHYCEAAIKCQSTWRGHRSRELYHDHKKLRNFQKMAARELIHCVAYKLHQLLRTRKIPGVYSLRNSKCLSKVEKLLACLRFKKFNEQVRRERLEKVKQMNKDLDKVRGCKSYVDVPYAGADPIMPGEECAPLYNMKDVDKRMIEILEIYNKNPDAETNCEGIRMMADKAGMKKPGFCEDIVESMRRWKILNECSSTIEPSCLRRPENIESFIDEMNCHFGEEQEAPC